MTATAARRISAWIIAVLLAASFIAAGVPKISPDDGMIRRFENWGYSAEFAILIGVLEALGGLLALAPQTASIGAGLITVIMIGAVWTHLSTGIGSPLFAAIYIVMAVLLFVLRLPDAFKPLFVRNTDKST